MSSYWGATGLDVVRDRVFRGVRNRLGSGELGVISQNGTKFIVTSVWENRRVW